MAAPMHDEDVLLHAPRIRTAQVVRKETFCSRNPVDRQRMKYSGFLHQCGSLQFARMRRAAAPQKQAAAFSPHLLPFI
jgi:hypothetical protein